jgi:transcriptional regulator with XRE-family HTH domain
MELDAELAARMFAVVCDRTDLTKVRLAEELGTSRPSLDAWISGERAVSLDTFLAACRLANVWPYEAMIVAAVENPQLVAVLPRTVDFEAMVSHLAVLRTLVERIA